MGLARDPSIYLETKISEPRVRGETVVSLDFGIRTLRNWEFHGPVDVERIEQDDGPPLLLSPRNGIGPADQPLNQYTNRKRLATSAFADDGRNMLFCRT